MLVDTDVCVRLVFVGGENRNIRIPKGNPAVWLAVHMTISHADAEYRTRVAAVRGERDSQTSHLLSQTNNTSQPLFN